MDPLSVSASIIEILTLSSQILLYLKYDKRTAISRTYGRPLGWVLTTLPGNTATEYERIERVVLHGSDAEALRFRDSVITECSMTAVAGAIIAQVALTALSLPSLSLAHWTARACLLFATVAGCLSVYYACTLSRDVGKCYQPQLVRDWLSLMTPKRRTEVDDKKERTASLSGIFILSAPYTMMSYSILAFITGLAIYQGFVWTRALDTDAGKTNSRNVFIAYIVSTGFCQLFFFSAGVIKAIESLLMYRMKPREWIGNAGNGGESVQLERYSSTTFTKNTAGSTQNENATSHQQGPKTESLYGGLAAALEAAAKAHILSAEADRRVALEYARLPGQQKD